MTEAKRNKLVIVVSRGTVDGVFPPLILATTAAAQGKDVHLYFTFGGMKFLNRNTVESLGTSVDLGVPLAELKTLLDKGGMPSPLDMLRMAKQSGVKIHACSPTMSLYGTRESDLIPEVSDVIGAATYLDLASDPDAITLFV